VEVGGAKTGTYEDLEGRPVTPFSTFFKPSAIPSKFHSTVWTNTEGVKFSLGSIADLARWSMTAQGAKRDLTPEELQAEAEEDEDFDAGLSCKSAMGSCE
jgi:hypothetical protein